MDIKKLGNTVKAVITKYKYAAVILLVGVGFLVLPQKSQSKPTTEILKYDNTQIFDTNQLVEILQSIEGAGKVKVLLSIASGERTIYQMDTDVNISGENNSTKQETVVVTDAQRAEAGLINQVNPPTYLGAIVVCEGADSASVRFAVTQAVAKITGLRTDNICVLKMGS